MKKYDIITLGGAVVDAFIDTGISQNKKQICIPMGAKILVESARFATGGGGTNSAVSFSKLGLKTGFIGKLGEDESNHLILSELKKNKIDFLGAFEKESTGFSIILDSNQHNRTILINKGSNDTLEFSEIPISKIKTNWLYFSSAINKTLQTQITLAKWAKEKGIKVAYNPSYYLTVKGVKKIRKLLKNVDVLILNEEEAQGLVPNGDPFKSLHALGPKYVCITQGKKGNKVSDGLKTFHSLPRKIKVRERTGAGDAFASGFVTGLIKFNDLKKAIALGSLNAESVIQIPGAKNGLLTWPEAKKQLEKEKIKITDISE
ncbi:MAG: carbohydrate kinase family protein [Nanoarchaeota archaeon]|nr:carbohydrate kinase family protein [Nanoarchaeota archaeon]